MKKRITVLFMMFIAFNCFAQKMKDLKVLNHFSFNNGDLYSEGYLEPGGIHIQTSNKKTYTWFAGGQLHQTQGNYKDRLLDGTYTDSYANKQLAKKGTYKKGLQKGAWYSWREDGTLSFYSHYKKGQLNRYQISYDSVGFPAKRTHYRKGIKQGLEQNYEEGQWKSVGRYKNGKSVPLKEPFIKRSIDAIRKKFRKKD